jgi:hypothetical protein
LGRSSACRLLLRLLLLWLLSLLEICQSLPRLPATPSAAAGGQRVHPEAAGQEAKPEAHLSLGGGGLVLKASELNVLAGRGCCQKQKAGAHPSHCKSAAKFFG